jgi:transcription elongation GreA/GreB family factor
MARTADRESDSPHTADGGQQRSPRNLREPEAAAVVLTPKGQRRLAARAAWLATGPIPRFAHYCLDDPAQDGWASTEYGHDVRELALLTRILQRAITTDQLPPENPGIVELGDEVAVEFANDSQRFLVVSPIEASLDDLNISVESPLGQALVGRRVGDQVEVDAPAGRFRCRILTTGRYQTAAPRWPKTSGSWVMEGGMGRVRPLPPWEDPV